MVFSLQKKSQIALSINYLSKYENYMRFYILKICTIFFSVVCQIEFTYCSLPVSLSQIHPSLNDTTLVFLKHRSKHSLYTSSSFIGFSLLKHSIPRTLMRNSSCSAMLPLLTFPVFFPKASFIHSVLPSK